jgi:hypothetical protein
VTKRPNAVALSFKINGENAMFSYQELFEKAHAIKASIKNVIKVCFGNLSIVF